MSVRIRFARIGKKKAPFYRIVAIDSRVKRDGKFLENLGTYNPLSGEIVQFHADRIEDWINKGAIPSDTVVKLQRRAKQGQLGKLGRVAPVLQQKLSKAELEAQEAEKKAAEAATTTATKEVVEDVIQAK